MNWSEWQGTADRIPTMWIRRLLERFGCRIDLHKFVRGDDGDCFHTHPAYALRIILRGGYIEELEDGRLIAWRAGDVGLVAPATSHRVDAVLYGRPAYTLWLRGPKIAEVQLRGIGWPKGTPWSCQRCGARGIGRELLDSEACPDCGLVL